MAVTMNWAPVRALAATVLTLLLVAQPSGLAIGHHGGRDIGSLFNCDRPGVDPPRCTSVADNLVHHVHFDQSLTEGLASSLRDTMVEDYTPTDFTMIEQPEVTWQTDVTVFSQDYGDNGAAGWVYCPTDAPQGINSSGHRWCRHQELHLNLNARYGAYFADDASRDHVTCHELGHTIGLRHWGNPPASRGPEAYTCMHANTPDGPVSLHQIDVDHINAYSYDTRPPFRLRHTVRAPAQDGAAPMLSWGGSAVEAMELEHVASLAELTRSADVVVRGRITDVTHGRVFSGLHYAAATVRADAAIAETPRSSSSGQLTVEIPLFGGPDTLDDLRASAMGVEAIMFLRNKGESARVAGLSRRTQQADAAFYRLITFDAIVVNREGRAAVPPDAPQYLGKLGGLAFDDVIRRIESLR